jgi:phosphoribosylanthranilate isomerase
MKIKICGLFREEDIEFVNICFPDYIGFVFAESKRRVSANEAAQLRKKLSSEIIPVGVFVNAEICQILSLYQNGVISVAQLHGNEDENYIKRLKFQCDIPVIKAVRIFTGQETAAYQSSNADFLLLDSGAGGTGTAFNWKKIGEIPKPYFLAGGINLNNISEAIAQSPYCIDVSSGAETNGIKDFKKIQNLVTAVRAISD